MDIISLLSGDSPVRANLAVVESTLHGGQMTPLHVHSGEEVVQVVAGSVIVCRGADSVRLRAGEALLLPAGEPHAVQADAAACIRSASFVTSVARYEDFLRAVAAPGGGLCDQDAATLEAIGSVNGIRVVGAPGEPHLSEHAA